MRIPNLVSIVLVSSTLALASPGIARAALPPDDAKAHAGPTLGVDARFGGFLNTGACAPDTPEPVWGAGGELLGYKCVPTSANGG